MYLHYSIHVTFLNYIHYMNSDDFWFYTWHEQWSPGWNSCACLTQPSTPSFLRVETPSIFMSHSGQRPALLSRWPGWPASSTPGFSLCPASWLTDKWGIQSPVPAAPHLILISSSALALKPHQVFTRLSHLFAGVLFFTYCHFLDSSTPDLSLFFWLWFLPDDFGYLCSANPVSVQPFEYYCYFSLPARAPTLTVPLLCLTLPAFTDLFCLTFWHRIFAQSLPVLLPGFFGLSCLTFFPVWPVPGLNCLCYLNCY